MTKQAKQGKRARFRKGQVVVHDFLGKALLVGFDREWGMWKAELLEPAPHLLDPTKIRPLTAKEMGK